MRKSRQKKQTFYQRRQENDDWTVKPLNEHQKNQVPSSDHHQDDIEQPQTSSTSNFNPSSRINFKWVSKNGGTQVKKSVLEPKYDEGGSNFGENGGVLEVDERESEVGERKCEVDEVMVGGEKIEGSELSEESGVDDVVRRLEELQFGVEEVELSEEQIRINDQAQEDEVCLVNSYTSNSFLLLNVFLIVISRLNV